MGGVDRVRSPVGLRDRHWCTRVGFKSVLVMVPHEVAGARLLDLRSLFEADHRVQLVFTVPEAGESWRSTHDFLTALGAVVLPWAQARQLEFDLVLAASTRGVDDVLGPVLLVPHGGGLAQYRPWRPPVTTANWQPVTGLDPDQLLRDGEVRAEAIALTHDDELAVLARTCPRAVPAAVVAGNIAFDRLSASVPLRGQYRRALGVAQGQQLVVVTSTWSERSAFGRYPDLFERVLAELPPERYRVVGALHPQIWAHHGAWQVRLWLADCLNAGLGLLPPEEGWRAGLAAADAVLGDYGSVTGFAAGIGIPVLWATDDVVPLLPGSPTAVLAERVRRWDAERPLVPQLAGAAAVAGDIGKTVRSLLTSRPGRAAASLRRTAYRLLRLEEPVWPVTAPPVRMPVLLPW